MRVTLFGSYASSDAAAQGPAPSAAASRLITFLTLGPEAVDLDAELARMLRAEFAAQERYRQQLVAKVTELRASRTARAAVVSAELETPYTRAGEYAAGFRAGRYSEATDAAQAVQTLLNELMEGAGT